MAFDIATCIRCLEAEKDKFRSSPYVYSSHKASFAYCSFMIREMEKMETLNFCPLKDHILVPENCPFRLEQLMATQK